MKFWFKQVLIAIDQFFNALFGGWADETFSSRTHRNAKESFIWYNLEQVIDLIFLIIEKDHCKSSYESEIQRLQLPPEFRIKQ